MTEWQNSGKRAHNDPLVFALFPEVKGKQSLRLIGNKRALWKWL